MYSKGLNRTFCHVNLHYNLLRSFVSKIEIWFLMFSNNWAIEWCASGSSWRVKRGSLNNFQSLMSSPWGVPRENTIDFSIQAKSKNVSDDANEGYLQKHFY